MIAPVVTISRRDIRDSFSDWRTLIPVFVLAFFVPIILQFGLRIAADFLAEAALTKSIVPFGLQIAGFLPAAFSLVGPLEAFVGERERNTLESLLSAPISNLQLYLGKYIAACTPPLIASTIAMVIYTVSVHNSRSSEFAAALTWGWVGITSGLVLLKLFTMVTTALYISSHTNSVRSANLLASLILLPMGLAIQAEALLFVQRTFSIVVLLNLGIGLIGLYFLVQGVISFDREAILAREHRVVRSASSAAVRASEHQYGPIITIVRREIRDIVTDWRLLIPLLVLMVLVPSLGAIGTVIAHNTLDQPGGIRPLMPFLLLLIGFLPASFSLITALEIFVGEKERGSLESLFSMPISDTQLYLGKSLAALLPPLASSLLGMLIYYIGLRIDGAADLIEPLTLGRIGGMTALSITQALAMVAGAVIISSHTSTVRLANLLASFVLLPITVVIQIEAVLIIGQRFDVMVWIGLALLVVAGLLTGSGMRSFNRESILSREHLALNWAAIGAAAAAFFREIRPAGVDPDTLAKDFSLRRFYTHELRVVWREIRLALLGVVVVVLIASIYGTIFHPINERQTQVINALVATDNIGSMGRIPSPLAIFARNSRNILFTGLLASLSFGFFSVMVPMIAFFSVAYGAKWAADHSIVGGAWGFLAAYALPHGIVELSAAIIAAAIGLRVGAAVVYVPSTYSVGRHLLWGLALFVKVWLLLLVPLLFIAALIETSITPQVFQMIYGG